MKDSVLHHRLFTLVWSLTVAAAAIAPLEAQTDDELAVRRTAERLLEAISARDTVTLHELMFPDTPIVSVVLGGDSTVRRWRSRDEMLRGMATSDVALLERMWDPEIRVSGDIATVWTPYDFYVDRQFSHCGIDAFQLVRTREGWRVVSVFYTVVRPEYRCEPSPLGPPSW